jgi:hypothetical protein
MLQDDQDKSRGPYEIDEAVGPVETSDASTVNGSRCRWERRVVVPLRIAVSLSLESKLRRLTYLRYGWTKWAGVVQRVLIFVSSLGLGLIVTAGIRTFG